MKKTGKQHECILNPLYHRHDFEFDGIVYNSVFHAFYAQRLKESDKKVACKIKDFLVFQRFVLRRQLVDLVMREEYDTMKKVVRAKFKSNGMRKALIGSGDFQIRYLSDTGDTYWGMVKIKNSNAHVGSNFLGKIMMDLREILKRTVKTKMKE